MSVIASTPIILTGDRTGGDVQGTVPVPQKATIARIAIDRSVTTDTHQLSLGAAVSYDNGKSWADMGAVGCVGYDADYDAQKDAQSKPRESGMYVWMEQPDSASRLLKVTYGQNKQATAGVKVDFS